MNADEKIKAYDNALEQARKELATCGNLECDAARQIYRLFPQLKPCLTEFEQSVKKLLNFSVSCESEYSDEEIKTEAKELLDSAKKEILPKWKKIQSSDICYANDDIGLIYSGLLAYEPTKLRMG